jgi:hypothetical protein
MVVNRNPGEGKASAQPWSAARRAVWLVPSVSEDLTHGFNTVVATCKYRKSPIYREPPFYSKLCP